VSGEDRLRSGRGIIASLGTAVRKRRLATFSIAFALATVFWQLVPAWTFLLIPAVLFAVGIAFLREHARVVAVILSTGFLLGSVWCIGHDFLYLRPAQELDRERGEIEVTLTTFPRETAYFTEVQGRLVREGAPNIPMTLRLDEVSEPLSPGDTILVEAILYRADEIQGNRVWRHVADGIFLRGFVSGRYTITGTGNPLFHIPQYVNRAVVERVSEIFPEDTLGFVTAVLTGDRSAMDPVVQENLRRSGIAHLVAVSGMHVVLLASLLFLVMGRSRKSILIAIPMVFLFALMTGGAPSTLRAALMQTLILLAPLFDRESDKITSLSGALFLILLLNPLAIASVGLQLSFLAIVGMHGVTPRVNRYLNGLIPAETKSGKWARKFAVGSLATSFGAMVFTTPILIFHMGTVSVYAPLTDLLTVWAATFIFGLSVLVAIVGFVFLPAAQILAWPVIFLVRYVQWIASGIAQLPGALLWTFNIYTRVWLVVLALMVGFYVFYKGKKPRAVLPVSLCAGLFLFLFILGGLENQTGGLRTTVLDVGQGQTVVLTSPEFTAMIDVGAGRGFHAGHIASEYLFGRNIYSLDFLILTHFHQDHINGLDTLLRRMDVGRILLPDRPEGNRAKDRVLASAEIWGVPVYFIRSDTVFPFGDSSLHVIAPVAGAMHSENERGITVLASAGDFDVLIMGDLYSTMERRLVQLVDLPSVEVLVVGHHGSRTSTSYELLEAITPRVALISLGYENQHGHPHWDVLSRLYRFGTSIYRTDRSGTLTVRAG